MMTSVSEVANEERTARMVLSMLIEPNDPVTGRILSRLGAVETLWLAERDGAVVGLSPVDAQVWKAGQAPFVRRITCDMPTWGPVWYQNDAALPRVLCLDHMVRVGSTPPTVEQTSAGGVIGTQRKGGVVRW